MLYIIAGASSSGKSSTRMNITKKFGISGIDVDTLRTMASVLRPDLNVGHTQDVKTNYNNMRSTISAFLYARSFFNEDYLLEGDAINLEDLKAYMKSHELRCIVLGYPNDTIEERLQVFYRSEPSHWSHTIDHEALREKVINNIEYSKFLMEESHRLQLPFLEVSCHNSIEQNIQAITSALLKQE